MENREDNIIEGVRESLINYELPYEEGAWERFCERQKETEVITVPFKNINGASYGSIKNIMAIAASLILLISIISVYNAYHVDNQERTVKVERLNHINE